MIWFGSSAGVALTNMYPEGKSVGRWVRQGWPVAAAYVIGFFVMLAVIGWHPDAPRYPEHRTGNYDARAARRSDCVGDLHRHSDDDPDPGPDHRMAGQASGPVASS